MMAEAMTLTPQSHNSLTLKLTMMETSEHFCNFAQAPGDKQLQRHLSTASNNATYISKTSRNDLIASRAAVFTEKIAQRVRQAIFCSFSR